MRLEQSHLNYFVAVVAFILFSMVATIYQRDFSLNRERATVLNTLAPSISRNNP